MKKMCPPWIRTYGKGCLTSPVTSGGHYRKVMLQHLQEPALTVYSFWLEHKYFSKITWDL